MYSITKSAVESWNKTKKQPNNTILKEISPIILQQLSLIFILNHINNLPDHIIIYMILLVPRDNQNNYLKY